MTRSSHHRQRPLVFLVAAVAALLVLAGCSTSPDVSSSSAAALALPGPVTVTLPDANPQAVQQNPTPQLPATVTNADGTRTTVRSADRIVALDQYGTIGTTIFALGLGSHLVGRDIATKFPAAEHIPNLTVGGTGINVESIFKLRPTVVLVDQGLQNLQTTRDALTKAGVAVVVLTNQRSVDGAPDFVRSVGQALGVSAAGDTLAQRVGDQITAAKQAATDKLHGNTGPRVAFIYARGTGLILLGGKGSGVDTMLAALGAQDASAVVGVNEPFLSVTSDTLVKAAPQVLLMMTDGLKSLGGVDGLRSVPGLAQTPAVTGRHVLDMDDGELLTFGPRTGEVLQALAAALYS